MQKKTLMKAKKINKFNKYKKDLKWTKIHK